MSSSRKLTLGFCQYASQPESSANIARAEALLREAAEAGAQLVCLQELCNTPYFCRSQDDQAFDLAEPIPGPLTEHFEALARELNLLIILPFFERAQAGLYFNSAVVLDPKEGLLGRYRKEHIPQDPGFEEKFFFAPGDLEHPSFQTRHGTIGVRICWDQWFPEAARISALAGAEILFYPTAIGWLPDEKEGIGQSQRHAWEQVQRGHAVANGCFLVAVNRVGTEGDTEFWGGSFVANPYGEIIAQAEQEEGVHTVTIDLAEVEAFRRTWPFFRDRRIDRYQPLLNLSNPPHNGQ